MTIRAALVVPCFNEGKRLIDSAVLALLNDPRVSVLLVDDGSTDETAERLAALARDSSGRIEWLKLESNGGKGEAVRRGLLAAIASGMEIVGYADADFSTDASEMHRLLGILVEDRREGVIGSRWAHLGARISRRVPRHLAGRVFATFAAVSLDHQVYDTQCGAKWFMVTPDLREALRRPFRSRWAFDVELLARLRHKLGESIVEAPLRKWAEVPGSKLSLVGASKAVAEVAVACVAWRLLGRRP